MWKSRRLSHMWLTASSYRLNICAFPHIWLCNRSHLNLLIYEEILFYFLSVYCMWEKFTFYHLWSTILTCWSNSCRLPSPGPAGQSCWQFLQVTAARWSDATTTFKRYSNFRAKNTRGLLFCYNGGFPMTESRKEALSGSMPHRMARSWKIRNYIWRKNTEETE